MAPWSVDNVDSQRACLPTLPTALRRRRLVNPDFHRQWWHPGFTTDKSLWMCGIGGLQDLLTRAGDIGDFLDATVEAFQNIDQTVSMDWHTLYLDAMNLEAGPEAGRSGLSLCAIRIGRRQPRIVQLIKFSPDFVSVDTGKALRRAARALGVH